MDLNERLIELAKMKADGLLSDQEFATLTDLAKNQSSEKAFDTPSSNPTTTESPFYLQKKFLVGSSVALIVVVGFVLMQGRSDDPLQSKEYKKLLDIKSERTAKQQELEAMLTATPDKTEELEIATARVERWKDAFVMINESGL